MVLVPYMYYVTNSLLSVLKLRPATSFVTSEAPFSSMAAIVPSIKTKIPLREHL